jgi:phage FluMu gp28-like protein
LTPDQFVADCRARSGLEQIFQQSYLCNPVPGGASIVDWSAIERCRHDYEIERVHLEADDISRLFGQFDPSRQQARQSWDFLKTVLFFFLEELPSVQAAGDESGLGRQLCWEAASRFPWSFLKVNFSSKKHDLAFALMNQLSVAQKRFPREHQDIAADYFALRKIHTGTRWTFTEGRNTFNPASHCDIAWAGALATYADTEIPNWPLASVG